MTVSTTTSRVEYAGNGATTAFAAPFYFLANGDLKVYQAGVLKTITTHYTVSGAGNPAGGTVTFLAAPAAGEDVVIFRDPAITQTTDYAPNDPFPAESHERALDRLTMIAQRNRDLLERSFTLADSTTGTIDTTLPDPSADKVIAWNSDGDGLVNRDINDFATTIAFSDWRIETFDGDGSTAAFVLAADPSNVANTDVSVGGVTQTPGIDYTLASSTITFLTGAPPAGTDNICVRYGQALPQGTIGNQDYGSIA